MIRPLPPQRQKVMDYITAELNAGRAFPKPGAIQKHMGWKNYTSAADALDKLEYYDRALTRNARGQYQVRAG